MCKTSRGVGKIQGIFLLNHSTTTTTALLLTSPYEVMDSSQRVWASTFYSLPSVLSTCGWIVPYLASNVGGGDCGAVAI